MPLLDNRTPHLDLEIPYIDNQLSEDVDRLASAIGKIDAHAEAVDTALTEIDNELGEAANAITSIGESAAQSESKLSGLSEWIKDNLFPASNLANAKSVLEIPAAIANTDGLGEGATNLYHTAARVRAAVLTGLSVATAAAVEATDTVLAAIGKLQANITAILPRILPAGGTAGQALIKTSGDDYLVAWGSVNQLTIPIAAEQVFTSSNQDGSGNIDVTLDCTTSKAWALNFNGSPLPSTSGDYRIYITNLPTNSTTLMFVGHVQVKRGGRKGVVFYATNHLAEALTVEWPAAPEYGALSTSWEMVSFYWTPAFPTKVFASIVDGRA